MENSSIPKEIIKNIPPNLFYHSKTRKKMKLFYQEFRKLINEKAKKKESLINIKKDLFLLQKKLFPDIYNYFYNENNFDNLEIYIY